MRLAAALLGVALPSGALLAQQVERVGSGDVALDGRLDRLLAAGDYTLITRDTLLVGADTIPGNVLVLDATAIVEGAVAGDLIAVDANVFLRPSARVHGSTVNVGGGLYRSALARIGGEVVDVPLAPYRVVREPGRFRIEARSDERTLVLDGFKGFHAPTYDRVNAATLEWGATYRPAAFAGVEPRLHGQIGYLSGRGALTGGLALALERAPTTLTFGAEETVATNEHWIRGDLRNSLSFLVAGHDYRNYYEIERVYGELERRFGSETQGWTIGVGAQLEHAKSLNAGSPWTLFGDEIRQNPHVDDGRIASVFLTSNAAWQGLNTILRGGGRLELAGEAVGGDFSFARFVFWGESAMRALADHTLEIEWRVQGPLPGTESLPRQRWSFIGGSGTLNTFSIGRFRGDRLVFAESQYLIPLPRSLELPLVGVPDLALMYAAGAAWTEDTSGALEQNIGVGLEVFGLHLRLWTDPLDAVHSLDLDFGLSWPFGADYPWQGEPQRSRQD